MTFIHCNESPYTGYRIPYTVYRIPYTVYRIPYNKKDTVCKNEE